MTLTVGLLLLIVAAVLAVIEVMQKQGRTLLGWAVLLIALVLVLPSFGINI